MPSEDNTVLKENLRLICGHYRSIADVCRKLGMNRQQFNKYLSGTTVPSQNSLRKMAEFFELDTSDFSLPHQEFSTRLDMLKTRNKTPDAEKSAKKRVRWVPLST